MAITTRRASVRYSRLSRVRRLLGYTGPAPEWSEADKIAVDANYMAVDIVINYAADGLVLCFHHAVVDLTPRDNDEHNKTGWTNWCGTPNFNMEQVQILYQQLQSAIPQPPTVGRVFQILLNQPTRPLWLSWPIERPGEPTSKDFARLAEDVHISSTGTDAKTSCTRRYKACQIMDFGMGDKQEVESIFIPHGSRPFFCLAPTPPNALYGALPQVPLFSPVTRSALTPAVTSPVAVACSTSGTIPITTPPRALRTTTRRLKTCLLPTCPPFLPTTTVPNLSSPCRRRTLPTPGSTWSRQTPSTNTRNGPRALCLTAPRSAACARRRTRRRNRPPQRSTIGPLNLRRTSRTSHLCPRPSARRRLVPAPCTSRHPPSRITRSNLRRHRPI